MHQRIYCTPSHFVYWMSRKEKCVKQFTNQTIDKQLEVNLHSCPSPLHQLHGLVPILKNGNHFLSRPRNSGCWGLGCLRPLYPESSTGAPALPNISSTSSAFFSRRVKFRSLAPVQPHRTICQVCQVVKSENHPGRTPKRSTSARAVCPHSGRDLLSLGLLDL